VEVVSGRVLVRGEGQGPLLRLRSPISFWGGVDPETGTIADPRHPDHGRSISGTVLALPGAVGSSSSSAIMLELLRRGIAPAAVLMAEADAILSLGVVVGAELGYEGVPVVEVEMDALDAWEQGTALHVGADGIILTMKDKGGTP
jgi:predicted aconitase with swiveling domain